MNPAFKTVLVIWAVAMYLVGIISWRVQNDALKRGYSSTMAAFWSLGIFFFAPVMLPLYIILRDRSSPREPIEDAVSLAKKKLNIVCNFCGEENPPENSFCAKCQRSLFGEGKAVGTRACQYCGQQNDINAVQCSNCRQIL